MDRVTVALLICHNTLFLLILIALLLKVTNFAMPPKCSRCSRPKRGHAGPVDEECALDMVQEGYDAGRYNEDSEPESLGDEAAGGKRTPKKSRSGHSASAMREVLHQLGKLTCNMQKLSDDTREIQECQTRFQTDITALKVSSERPAAVVTMPIVQVPQLPGTSAIVPLPQPQVPAIQDLPVPLSNGARISRKTYLAATTGEFINLAEFSPNTEPSSVMESVIDDVTGQLIFKTKNTKKAMDNFLTWSRAWAGYEGLLISLNTALYQRLSDYRLFVQGCDAIYHWAAVSSYDQRHRHLVSLNHSYDFNVCNMEIYCCTLNASSIRPNPKACFICGSIDHHMKDCPFAKQSSKYSPGQKKVGQGVYPSNSIAKTSQPFVPRTDAQAFGESRPVLCYNWNNGRCSSPACWRLHVCSGCGGPDPRITCTRCNAKG